MLNQKEYDKKEAIFAWNFNILNGSVEVLQWI